MKTLALLLATVIAGTTEPVTLGSQQNPNNFTRTIFSTAGTGIGNTADRSSQ